MDTSSNRADALARIDAKGIHHHFATADVVIDPERTVCIAVDLEPNDADWAEVCRILRAVGYDNGAWPYRRDPGEPTLDALAGVNTWRLELNRA